MSMMIGTRNSNVTKYILKKPDGSVAGTMTVKAPSQKKLKRLQYNFKEISTLIMRTRTSFNARQVMSKAFIKVMGLRSKLRTGQYDDKEVQSAILHAEQLTRVARKRMKHLREEENAKKHGGICEGDLEEKTYELTPEEEELEDFEDFEESGMSEEELKELMLELEETLQELEKAMADAGGLEELSDELMPVPERELDPEDLELLKKKHRAEELRDIMEADMRYLKAMFEKLAKEKQEGSSHSGSDAVSLELNGMEVPIEPMDIPVPASGENIDLMA